MYIPYTARVHSSTPATFFTAFNACALLYLPSPQRGPATATRGQAVKGWHHELAAARLSTA